MILNQIFRIAAIAVVGWAAGLFCSRMAQPSLLRQCLSLPFTMSFVLPAVCSCLSVVCFLRFDSVVLFVRNGAFLLILLLSAVMDCVTRTIPDACIRSGVLLWLAVLPWTCVQAGILSDTFSLLREAARGIAAAAVLTIGILTVTLFLEKLMHCKMLGGGDIKLLALCGLYLGLFPSLYMLLLACLLALPGIGCGSRLNINRPGLKRSGFDRPGCRYFAFGPYLAAAAGILLLAGA